jgi:uncharacterized membrane protein
MTLNLTEDRPMRLSNIPNRIFWPLWSVLLAAVIVVFLVGKDMQEPVKTLAIVAFVAGMLTLCLSAGLRQQKLTGQRSSPAARRYVLRFVPAMMGYAIALIGALWLFNTYHLLGWPADVVAVAPALPVLVAIWAIGRFMVEEDDEFQRKLMVESYMIATAATLGICTVVGFLQSFDLMTRDIPLWAVFPLLAACLIPAQGWVKWKYR